MKLRLILGDQLHYGHSWFKNIEEDVVYVLMEVRSETDYVKHHIQKVLGIFLAMRSFKKWLEQHGHKVYYFHIGDPENKQSFRDNLIFLSQKFQTTTFEYLLPDEFRLDHFLEQFCLEINEGKCLPLRFYFKSDTEHFFTERLAIRQFFKGKKIYLMESFYRDIRKRTNLLMDGDEPIGGQWNFDKENRKKLPDNHLPPTPLEFPFSVTEIIAEIENSGIKTMGHVDPIAFVWPINRAQALELLEYFCEHLLVHFGTYEDAMSIESHTVYHSRLSFVLNIKILTPMEVVQRAIAEYQKRPTQISLAQIEGFVRQIVGWREYMRGIYWDKMPEFSQMNFFENTRSLPNWFWTGQTKMNCLKFSLSNSLQNAYAHHIQRLMVIGNFSLIAGIEPSEVDAWYLGVYMDAIEWVEITNTRGMSQFADGGIVGSKPYAGSANYINKMSNYCSSCYYNHKEKVGEKACPFNSLYWHFYQRNEAKLAKNPRIGMVYNLWKKMDQKPILDQAEKYLQEIEEL